MTELTQKEQIKSLLLNRGSAGFSAYEAIYSFGITRAATYIFELRQEGWRIETEKQPGETARYTLVAPPAGIEPVIKQEVLW